MAGKERPPDRPLYGEAQRGGLCQMHALNAYFGRPAYTPATFASSVREYLKATGHPPEIYKTAGPMGLFGYLATSRADGCPKTLFHYLVKKAGDPFDEALGISDESQSPGGRRDRRAWIRPRLEPGHVARLGVRAVFVFTFRHVWVWRHGSTGSDPPRWHKIDSMVRGGKPVPGDPAREWNGPFGIAVAVPRHRRP